MAGSSKKLQDRFFKAIASGMNQRQAAKFAGIPARDIARWQEIYPDFEDRMEAAVNQWYGDSYTEDRVEDPPAGLRKRNGVANSLAGGPVHLPIESDCGALGLSLIHI